jgi:DNA primase
VLRIPYVDQDGREAGVRIRHHLTGAHRVLWRKESKAILYGLPYIATARELGWVVLGEGESDCHTLWHHGFPALGLPGANGWKEQRDAELLAGIDRIYVVIEQDKGGQAVLGWLANSAIRDRAWLLEMNGHKDPSELHLADPERFRDRFQAVIDAAEPWRDRAAQLETRSAGRHGSAARSWRTRRGFSTSSPRTPPSPA